MTHRSRRTVDLAVVVSIGLVLSIIETAFPPIIPLPGAKLGLGNIATVIALLIFGPRFALEVTVFRTVIAGILRGSVTGMVLSFTGGVVSTLLMIFIFLALRRIVGVPGMSVAGAAAHNMTQLLTAYLFVRHTGLFYYAPYLLIIAIPTGILIAIASMSVSRALKPLIPSIEASRARKLTEKAPEERVGSSEPTVSTVTPDDKIVLLDLSFTYPGSKRPALRRVNLTFERGKFYAILGRNGSGKSTLVKCLNALFIPSGGKVVSCGIETSDSERDAEIRRRVSTVFQNPETQILGTTVEEDVAFGPENLGLSTEVIRHMVNEALSKTGILHLASRNPAQLSAGEKQLVAIAGALAVDPMFLISDECTSMLDSKSRERIINLFKRLKEKGMGIVHVTHFLEEALECDTVIVLEEGQVCAAGKPRDILADGSFLRSKGLEALPATRISDELGKLGISLPERTLDVEELIGCL